MSTCRECAHWKCPVYPGSDYDSRANPSNTEMPCTKLRDLLNVEIEYSRGYGGGDGTLGEISTPHDFACNRFEQFVPTLPTPQSRNP